MQILSYRYKPKFVTTVLFIVFLSIFIRMGMWQSAKADAKEAKREIFEQRHSGELVRIGEAPVNTEEVLYAHGAVSGIYDTQYTILLDNRMNRGKAGYHVITPLRIKNSDMRILVNRGWVPVGNDRAKIPDIDTPKGEIELHGMVHEISGRYLELSKEPADSSNWQIVWQNLDIERYSKAVNFPLQGVMLLLDPDSKAGGYVREWSRPDLKIEMNRGYAMQWYFMSLALTIIYFVTNIKKIPKQE